MMACSGHKPPYQRLEKLPPKTEEDEISGGSKETAVVLKRRRRLRLRLRLRLNRSGRWRRPRKLLSKAAVVGAAVRVSVAKVIKRLKEGRPYLGELFAGNYMFMQVSPSPTIPRTWRSQSRSLSTGTDMAHHHHRHHI
ncbi:hypothetical protein BHE74_00034555 [Ensete ventricosum]|nr:hypothetical protein BHE74_00034555 [Ensete ventricosum]